MPPRQRCSRSPPDEARWVPRSRLPSPGARPPSAALKAAASGGVLRRQGAGPGEDRPGHGGGGTHRRDSRVRRGRQVDEAARTRRRGRDRPGRRGALGREAGRSEGGQGPGARPTRRRSPPGRWQRSPTAWARRAWCGQAAGVRRGPAVSRRPTRRCPLHRPLAPKPRIGWPAQPPQAKDADERLAAARTERAAAREQLAALRAEKPRVLVALAKATSQAKRAPRRAGRAHQTRGQGPGRGRSGGDPDPEGDTMRRVLAARPRRAPRGRGDPLGAGAPHQGAVA